jgi:cyclase
MLKKRLIGVVTVKDNQAVQSFGYNQYLPLGSPLCMVENLDRWEVDEILLQIIDRSENNLGPDFKLLNKIASLGLQTPLIYSGGINSFNDGVDVIQRGADRIAIDYLLHKNLEIVDSLSKVLGSQAIIGSLPLAMVKNKPFMFNYLGKKTIPINKDIINCATAGLISELLIIDSQNEGRFNGFNKSLLNFISNKKIPLILFGGISEVSQINQLIKLPTVSALAIGNFLSYKEHAVQRLKESAISTSFRAPWIL